MKTGNSICGRGFTLLELLLVVSIMMVLFTLLAPATRSVLDSFHVTQALNVVLGTLDEAKERAVSLNRPIEVWICRSTTASPSNYRVIQVISHEPSGILKPVGRPLELPQGTCITSGTTWSSLLSLTDKIPGSVRNEPPVGSLKMNYVYKQLTFYPSGTTDLDSAATAPWFLTIMSERSEAQGVLAKNFATIQIDPVNGLTTARRP